MASITGINSYLYSDYNSLISNVNTSTERFKGSVTGYKPVEKSSSSTSATLSSQDTKSYIADLKDNASKLKTAAANLTQTGQSVFSKLTATSTKDETLSVSVSNQADASQWADAKKDKSVTVQQLAAAQKNTGNSLSATGINGADSGTNQFTIEKDGKTRAFSVNINATDSNRTAQQKMADAINKQNVGISASVEYDEKTKKSALVLSSKETGQQNAFTIADVEGRGNVVAALGADQTVKKAQDAQYTVDGAYKTSDKNTVDLGDGISGTLKKVSAEPVKVTAKKDVSSISSAVGDVVNNFNALLKTTKDYGDDKNAKALGQRMDSIASSYASSLQNIGITRDKEGYLQIDSKKLTKAFEDGSAERFLGNNNAGFTQRVSQLAKSVSSNPDQFVSYKNRNNMNNESAGSSGGGYSTSAYSDYLSAYRSTQLDTMGLLLSMGV